MTEKKISQIGSNKSNLKITASGFDAIARGSYEAGVSVASGFPGIPTTDILNSLKIIKDQNPNYKVDIEWSTNQKVGFEIAISGTMSNARSLAVMKHIGVNVAADAFMTACYGGALGGFVLVSIDDPSMYNSENEQDNRYYGLHGLIPIFQPSSIQEVKDMIKYAYDFSEEYESLVLFQTTFRLIESKDSLLLGDVDHDKNNRKTRFTEEYRARWTHLPSNARVNRIKLLERLEKITKFAEEFPFNEFIDNGCKTGILTAGLMYKYTQDALKEMGKESEVSIFKLGMIYPYPRQKLIEFMKNLETLIVIEELEPIFEEYLKALAFEEKLKIKIIGKEIFPRSFEFIPELIKTGLENIITHNRIKTLDSVIPVVKPNDSEEIQLQEIFYKAAREVEEKHNLRFIYTGDFGCENFHKDTQSIVNTYISQGSSIGFANGIAKIEKGTLLSFLNNNSFYHSGYYGLINAVYNENDMIMVFVNELAESKKNIPNIKSSNESQYLKRQPTSKEDFEKLINGMGVPKERIFFTEISEEEIKKAFENAAKSDGVRVIISI